MNEKTNIVLAVAVTICLMSAMFAFRVYGGFPYNPWWDLNDDGKIDTKDVARVAGAFGTFGQNITKAGLNYSSGWLDISDMRGQSVIVTHNLNIADWDHPRLMVDIMGKTNLGDSKLQRQLGMTFGGWNKTYGATDQETAQSLVQTTDGGYALAGWVYISDLQDYDSWLVKTDSSGVMQWNETYGGTNADALWSIIQTADGGYALAGYSYSFGAGSSDFWLVRTNATGGMLWNKTYGGTEMDSARGLVQTADGGYALAGYTRSFGAGENDFWLVRTNATGGMLWNKTYGGIGGDSAQALVQTADGGYALAGYSNSFGAGSSDFWLVRTNATGGMLWNKTYGGTGYDYAYAVVQTADGGCALAGRTDSFGSGGSDCWLVKTSSAGDMLWNKTYGGTSGESARDLVQTADGGYALLGSTGSFGAGSSDFWLVKTNATGGMLWNKTYGGTGYDEALALVQTADGGYTLAGDTSSPGPGYEDFWLVKTDNLGNTCLYGLAWMESAADTITLYRSATDPYWNFVQVRIWTVREYPPKP